jgi:amino acid adenylation domain-containing protein
MDRKNIEDAYPLSPMQEGMLFHSLYSPESGVYVGQMAFELQGNLNVNAFAQAWQQVISRHAVFRSAFVWQNLERPIQVVGVAIALPWQEEDWQSASPQKQSEKLTALLETDRQEGFNLSQAPLMRLSLIRRNQRNYYFIWSYHQLLLDGWSLPIVFQEVIDYYQAFSEGKPLSLAKPRPYRDYIAWLQQQNLSASETFWRKTLAGFTTPTPVGSKANKTRSPQQENYTEQKIALSETTTTKINTFVKQHQLTINTLIQGAWSLLLSRYSGEEDVVFGSTVSGRPPTLEQAQTIVGLFINTLPVRVKCSPQKLIISWLKEILAQQVEARQYEYTPLVEIKKWSDVPSGFPLFESLTVFQNYPVEAFQQNHLGIEIRPLGGHEKANYPLTLSVIPNEQLLLTLEYDAGERFDDAAIARMLKQLETLLEGIIANPHQCLGDLSLLSPREQHQLLVQWNQTETQYPKDLCIQELFEIQVENTPDAVAVVFEDQHLTYRELNNRANQLAHYLQKLGVEAEILIGIYLERSVEMAIAILGILKAGGAYLPFDPAYPQERINAMLEDASIRIVLTGNSSRIDTQLPIKQIDLDRDWNLIAQQSTDNCLTQVSSENLAYVIYTSGSTGKPKGVAIAHQALVNYTLEIAKQFELEAKDRMLQFASVGFDVVVEELFPTWIRGATVVLQPDRQLISPTELLELIEKQQLSLLELPTAYWQQLLYELLHSSRRLPCCLRLMLMGGEAIAPENVKDWQQFGVPLMHVYGLTETTVTSTLYPLSEGQEFSKDGLTLPIGRAIANTQIYLLDSRMQPVPIGLPGELYIGGDGLARGYLHQAEMTAQKFIPHPFSQKPGARLYKTGDLARYLPDGNIEFLGRIDAQVKIRGFRIELGEIESVLAQHPDIIKAVVIDREDIPGQKRLVAYLVTERSQPLKPEQLRSFLRQQLPDYTIPAAFVELESLPLTPNGKVDRRALPVPEQPIKDLNKSSSTSFSYTQEILIGVWTQILNVKPININDNFFELGGHSLLATQVISKIRTIFKIALPLRCLFESPTVVELAEQIDKAIKAGKQSKIPAIAPVSRQESLPLSFAQQRLWFLDRLEPDSAAYNITEALQIQGKLQINALEQSFREIIKRHEILRTNFITQEEKPTQIIHPTSSFSLSIIDLTACSQTQQELKIDRAIEQEEQYLFNLEQEPLLRATLLKIAPEKYILLLTMHHIISDEWSTGILIRELTALYQAYCQGQHSPLPQLPIQYADFATWQRQWLQGEVLEQQLSYWKQQLQDLPPILELPTDRPRPPIQSYRGASQSVILPKGLSEALKAVAQQESVTLYMMLLAAFVTLLYRYTGQDDLTIGSPIANRNREQTESLIGFFVNTLVMRANVADNPSYRELLRRVRTITLEAYAHQDLPFEILVETLQPERNLSNHPLFQVMFVLQNEPQENLKVAGLTFSAVSTDSQTAHFDLSLEITESEEGLTTALEYSTDLFDAATIERMLGHFQVLLEAIATNPEQRLSDLPLLTPVEQQQLLIEWNDIEAEYPKKQCIHHLFEAQVEQSPDAVAVVFGEQHLTYQELNDRANQLAHYLQKRGVQPEVLVAIYLERSLEMMVAILGVLKAGGAYIPLDPAYPQQRLSSMLEDAQIEVLLTQQQLVDKLLLPQTKLVNFDRDWDFIAQQPRENCLTQGNSENLAYVIYTSGSTGKPKGVAIAHQALVNYTLEIAKQFGLQKSDRVLQFASIGFDVVVEELFPTWISGATVVLQENTQPIACRQFQQLIEKEQLTVFELPTAYWHQWVSELSYCQQTVPNCVRLAIVGGERISLEKLKQWQKWQTSLVHVYGLTETTVTSTLHYLSHEATQLKGAQEFPIGRPIANTQIYLLDPQMQPVPVGVTGEIYIGGAGLARGYLNQVETTADKFIPNPFSQQPGARLYRTGDLGRYNTDGNIEFLGRSDYQVKLRGFRIELGEIESVLSQHPSVKETVAMEREDISGDRTLVAYITLHLGQKLTSFELRSFLEPKLPNYMMPSAFVILEAFPLTPNGKIDRQMLPAPDLTQLISEANFVAPSTPVEKMLAGIWIEVLGIEKVGIHDNFFELGGHSLLATRIISRVRQVTGVELPLRSLFEKPTVADLAKLIYTALNPSRQQKIERVSRQEKLPLSFAQARLWFVAQLEPDSPDYNIPTPVRLQGKLNVAALEQSFNEIIRRHEILRTSFATVDGEPTQVIASSLKLNLPIIDLQELPKTEQKNKIEQLIAEEALEVFDLTKLPLFRLKLLRITEEEHILIFILHHIIFDRWSVEVLLREITALYESLTTENPLFLPDLPIQYADFATWQRQYLQKEVLENHLNYWKQQLGGKSMLPFPTDYPRSELTSDRGAVYDFALPKDLSNAIQTFCQREGATLFMTLFAAFNTVLCAYTGQQDIAIGSPVANRNCVDVEQLIGFFVNTLVLRTSLSGNPSFRELLARVREVVLNAYTHQELPYEKLVEALSLNRKQSELSLFQVWFTLENASHQEIKLSEISFNEVEVYSDQARYDLRLDFLETDEGLQGSLEYKTDSFEGATIERIAEYLVTILHQAIAKPNISLNELTAAIAQARQQQKSAQEKELAQTSLQKLKQVKRKLVNKDRN